MKPVIDQLLKHGLIFQALHQHFWTCLHNYFISISEGWEILWI
jgi:hypothetical protein